MSLTYQGNARQAAVNAIVALADAGAGAAVIQVATSGFASVLATITCADPAFTADSGGTGVAPLAGTPRTDAAADNTGTAAVWRLRDSNSNLVMDGPVATSGGGDINLPANVRNAALDAVNALCNGGNIQFATDSGFGTILATVTLNNPAFDAASGGSSALDITPALTDAVDVAGTCTFFRFRTSGNAEVMRGTVGTSGADWNFDNNVWGVGELLTLTGFTHSMAATVASSDGAMVINSTSIVAGQAVSITSGGYTQPAS